MYSEFKSTAPLRRNITIDDVGNSALYLCSDLAAGVTGEVHYVDAGFNILALAEPGESKT
jgi:enoyl-[acyl-carrier protein] reductase I